MIIKFIFFILLLVAQTTVFGAPSFEKENNASNNGNFFIDTVEIYISGNTLPKITPSIQKKLILGYNDYYLKAKAGDPIAQYYIASAQFYGGIGTGYHPSQVVTCWMKKSADQNYTPAIAMLGYMYIHSYQNLSGDNSDDLSCNTNEPSNIIDLQKKGLSLLQFAASKKNSWALSILGSLYLTGTIVDKDPKEAFSLFQQSSNLGFPTGQMLLGDMYYYGYGTKKDYKHAVGLYLKAIKNKKIAAFSLQYCQFQLGNAYLNGYGVQKNKTQAITWYKKSALTHYIPAINALISIYHDDRSRTNQYNYWTCFLNAVNHNMGFNACSL